MSDSLLYWRDESVQTVVSMHVWIQEWIQESKKQKKDSKILFKYVTCVFERQPGGCLHPPGDLIHR